MDLICAIEGTLIGLNGDVATANRDMIRILPPIGVEVLGHPQFANAGWFKRQEWWKHDNFTIWINIIQPGNDSTWALRLVKKWTNMNKPCLSTPWVSCRTNIWGWSHTSQKTTQLPPSDWQVPKKSIHSRISGFYDICVYLCSIHEVHPETSNVWGPTSRKLVVLPCDHRSARRCRWSVRRWETWCPHFQRSGTLRSSASSTGMVESRRPGRPRCRDSINNSPRCPALSKPKCHGFFGWIIILPMKTNENMQHIWSRFSAWLLYRAIWFDMIMMFRNWSMGQVSGNFWNLQLCWSSTSRISCQSSNPSTMVKSSFPVLFFESEAPKSPNGFTIFCVSKFSKCVAKLSNLWVFDEHRHKMFVNYIHLFFPIS